MRKINPHTIYGEMGYPIQSREMLEFLGVDRLPAEGMPPRKIQGVLVWVDPLPDRPPTIRHKRSAHRVMAECPQCKKHLSVGRLAQHVCPK